MPLVFRSDRMGRPSNGKEGAEDQATENPEVQGSGLHALRSLRQAKGGLSQVWTMSNLSSRDGARR